MEAAALAAIALIGRLPRQVSRAQRVDMRKRVERVVELFDFVTELRNSPGRAGHRR